MTGPTGGRPSGAATTRTGLRPGPRAGVRGGPGADELRRQQRVAQTRRTGGPVPPSSPAPRREPGRPDRRRVVLTVVVLVLLTVFAGRLVYLQGFRGEAVAAVALSKRLTSPITIPADRGEITDADGVVLATSVERYTVWANQIQVGQWVQRGDRSVKGPAGAARLLAPLLEANAAELGAKLAGDRGYVVLAKNVLPEVWRAIAELGIGGIGADRTAERVYPANGVGGNIIGFVGADAVGQAGLELTLDDQLTGTPGSMVYERGRKGQQIPGGYSEQTPAVPGESVQLTIKRDLQWKAQESLDAQVAATGSDRGAVLVWDIATGEILALADSGSVDPNDPSGTPAERRGSRAIQDVFEPGSTAKVITMAAAIETGLVTPETQFVVPYQYTTENGQTFKDSHEHADLNLTTAGILAESSNTGTVMIGQNLPKQVRYDYLAKFGFGKRTGVGLPGESPGIMRAAEDWDGRSQFAVLFGQSIAVNLVQATSVFATVANGGVSLQPHLVKGWTDADGTKHTVDRPEGRRVISEQTAATVLQMLEGAVDDGTGSQAQIPGYRVAGKTGTAQAANPVTGAMTDITASFIGVAPADAPRIAVSVILSNPRTSEWGGVVAAPVFSDVAGYALQELKVPPSGTTATLFPTTWQ